MNPYPMKQPDTIAMLDAERAIADQLFRASQADYDALIHGRINDAVRRQNAALEAQIAHVMATAPPAGAVIVTHPDGSQEFRFSQDKTTEQLIEELRENARLAKVPPATLRSTVLSPVISAGIGRPATSPRQKFWSAVAQQEAEAEPETQAEKDARWLRETLAKAGDDTASGNPFSGFRVDKTQAEADAEIAAALQARIDGDAAYMNGNPFRPDAPPAQVTIPEHLRKPRIRTPEEIAQVMAAGKFAAPSPVALWLEPDAARLRAEARQKAAEEQRLRETMSADAFAAATNFAASLAVTELMASFEGRLAPTFDAIRDLARDLAEMSPPPEPTAPGAGLRALRKATNRKAHWLK